MATTDEIIEELQSLARPEELPKVRKRLADDEPAFGLRMRDLFDTAKKHTALDLDGVHKLLDHPAYEPRLTAFCILDFKARKKLDDDQRRELCNLYINRHDRISTWDMVDRSAPRIVGTHVSGGPYDLLWELAAATAPLRRRTAMTAPLMFLGSKEPGDLDTGFELAERLLTDPEPVVHNAVGIFLKHAGNRAPERLHAILTARAQEMPRAGLRLAIEKLESTDRKRYLGQ